MAKLAAENDKQKAVASKKPSVKEVISSFCGYTTAHGLGRLADGGGVFRRITWSLFCIGALTMFVVQTYNLFAIYLRRPVSTVVTVQHDSVSIRRVHCCFTFTHYIVRNWEKIRRYMIVITK